jgi:hypothetical protein
LSRRVEQLCVLGKEAVNDMDEEIKTLDNETKQLEEAANSTKFLQKKSNDITKDLQTFDDEFLKLNK